MENSSNTQTTQIKVLKYSFGTITIITFAITDAYSKAAFGPCGSST